MSEKTKISSNSEIDQALKEFEIKSQIKQAQKAPEASKTSKIVELVMKYSGGFIKDQRQAEYVLLGFVILAIGISLFLFFSSQKSIEKPFEGGSNPQDFKSR